MSFFDKILAWSCFALVTAVIMLSPWLFGAWEMWWFWSFVILVFASLLFYSLRLLSYGHARAETDPEYLSSADDVRMLKGRYVVLSYLAFLTYAAVRFLQADVYMDAEKSFLLFLTPFLLGIQIVYGFDRQQRKILFVLVLANLLAIGLYGVINHIGWHNQHVLWAPCEPQYQVNGVFRATGPFFCPDHFSGVMELAICCALGLLMTRTTALPVRIGSGILTLLGLLGVVFSKSRGGGLTVIVIFTAALVWGFAQWKPSTRWKFRGIAVASVLLALVLFCSIKSGYMERFTSYFTVDDTEEASGGRYDKLIEKLRNTSRGRMIPAAIRAWKTEPLFGIGPGMHQNLWPHFAATPDGNRELGIWPSQDNRSFHSFEVHSDWIQLLEEYGLVGVGLFLVPLSVVFFVLHLGIRREMRKRARREWRDTDTPDHALVLGGLLAVICMVFHSLGDFNLQIPATTWMLAAIVSLSIAAVIQPDEERYED